MKTSVRHTHTHTHTHTLVTLLIGLLASQALLACGDSADTPSTDTGNADTTAAQTEAETEKPMWIDNLPAELDFNGEKIVIHTRHGGDDQSINYIEGGPAEEVGEVLSDSFYYRNRNIEDRLNVELESYKGEGWQKYSSEVSSIRASVAAGDNAWQIIAGWSAAITPLALENCFYDLLQFDYIDTAQPWWNQSGVEGMQIGGGLYFLSGDISNLSMLGGSFVLYMNDSLASQYDIVGIADTVLNGKWTIDKMAEIVKVAVNDLNGDSVMDENDQWGFVTTEPNPSDMFYAGSDIHQIVLEDGIPVFVPAEEKVSALYDKVFPFFYGGAAAGSLNLVEDQTTINNIFLSGNALMSCTNLTAAHSTYRDMEDDYTILPAPKFDEAQESYHTYASNNVNIYGIPSDNPTPDAAAAVMEAMAAYNYNSLTDVYFETCLQDKYARNPETVEMLKLIRDGAALDCEYLYRDVLGQPCYVMRLVLQNDKTGVASWYAKNTKRIEKAIAKTVDQLTALGE